MSTFAALCHFCEHHGPCVIMMTQGQRSDPGGSGSRHRQPPFDPAAGGSCGRPTGSSTAPVVDILSCDTSATPSLVPDASVRLFGLNSLLGNTRAACLTGPLRQGCAGCWSLGTDRGAIVSSEPDREITYVSTQDGFGYQSAWAKEAAIKSISCEVPVLPNKTGRMILSDRPTSSVYSQTFFLKDLMARGFQRYYSVIVGTRERSHLILAWDTISQSVTDLISILSSKASQKFNSESKDTVGEGGVDVFIRKRDFRPPSRNLSELTSDPAIFLLVHKHLARILATVENLRLDEVVTGQPLLAPPSLQEPRLELWSQVCRGLSLPHCRQLVFSLLAGRRILVAVTAGGSAGGGGLQLGRRVAAACSLLLPPPSSLYTTTDNLIDVVIADDRWGETEGLSSAAGVLSVAEAWPKLSEANKAVVAQPSLLISWAPPGCTCLAGRRRRGHATAAATVGEDKTIGPPPDLSAECCVCSPSAVNPSTSIPATTASPSPPLYYNSTSLLSSSSSFPLTWLASTSTTVNQLCRIGRCVELGACSRLMRVVAAIEAIRANAKVWRSLAAACGGGHNNRPQADNNRRIFLRKLGLGVGDGLILDHFQGGTAAQQAANS